MNDSLMKVAFSMKVRYFNPFNEQLFNEQLFNEQVLVRQNKVNKQFRLFRFLQSECRNRQTAIVSVFYLRLTTYNLSRFHLCLSATASA